MHAPLFSLHYVNVMNTRDEYAYHTLNSQLRHSNMQHTYTYYNYNSS